MWQDDPALRPWRRNVGPPVALELAPALMGALAGIDVLSWNLAIGAARLEDLLARLREDGVGTDAGRPLVVLAQEAFRAGPDVPGHAPGRHHGGKARGAGRCDVVETARELGLSLHYAPSMRNGHTRTDRGNAILSTAALGPAHAFELPHVRQRRVGLMAGLAGVPGLLLASAHLDVRGQPGGRTVGGFGTGRALQARALGTRLAEAAGERLVVLGADLNTPLGERDPAYRALLDSGFAPPPGHGAWGHTFHGPLRLPLDHVLLHGGAGRHVEARVGRLDESPRDRGRHVFGSDHHPLLLRLELPAAGQRRG